MKKILITLSAIFIFLAFTSCDTQRKIDEALDTEKASLLSLRETFDKAARYSTAVSSLGEGDYDLSKCISNDSTEKKAALKVMGTLLYCNNLLYEAFTKEGADITIEEAEGTLKIEKVDDDAYTVTATGVKINASCTIETEDYKDKIENATLTLDGVIYIREKMDYEEKKLFFDYNIKGFKENGISYEDIELSFIKDSSGRRYTKAVCDGRNVDLEILDKLWPGKLE